MWNHWCRWLISTFDLFSVSTLTSLSALLLTPCLSFVLAPCFHPSLLSSPPGWTASTRSMWRSAWLQVNAPRSHSSSPSITSWRWNRPLSWWRVEGESRCLLPCLPLFPCSKYWIQNCSNVRPYTCNNEHWHFITFKVFKANLMAYLCTSSSYRATSSFI